MRLIVCNSWCNVQIPSSGLVDADFPVLINRNIGLRLGFWAFAIGLAALVETELNAFEHSLHCISTWSRFGVFSEHTKDSSTNPHLPHLAHVKGHKTVSKIGSIVFQLCGIAMRFTVTNIQVQVFASAQKQLGEFGSRLSSSSYGLIYCIPVHTYACGRYILSLYIEHEVSSVVTSIELLIRRFCDPRSAVSFPRERYQRRRSEAESV